MTTSSHRAPAPPDGAHHPIRPGAGPRAGRLLQRSAPLLALLLLGACGASNPGAAGSDSPDPLDGTTAEELYERGVELGNAGDYVRAEQYIVAAMDRGYSEDDAMPALMRFCLAASRLMAALGYAEGYLQRHPRAWALRMLVASIRMGLDQADQAREELERVLDDAPEEPPEAHYFLGVLFRDELADMETSRAHFRRYLALAPQGSHREEALAALPPEERGLPTRVRAGASTEGGPERVEEEPEDAPREDGGGDDGATQ
jgi:tetratricopeptide (TPR) repeat protein